MIYGSVCDGIGGAHVAWRSLGWRSAWRSEIDPFCEAVASERFPEIRNLGDLRGIDEQAEAIELLVGGTPCQAFSVAGKRAGLDDPRGDLTLEYLALAKRVRPRWLVWENVPGVLSLDEGRTFGVILGLLGELGYGWTYRILDAQFDGLAQRRSRVFLVGYLGDWRPPAAVLLEPESMCGDSPPRRETGKGVAGALAASSGGADDNDALAGRLPLTPETARCLALGSNAQRYDGESETFVAHSLRAEGFDASEDGTGRGTPLVAFSCKDHGADAGEVAPTLRAMPHDKSHANAGGQVAIVIKGAAIGRKPEAGPQYGEIRDDGTVYTLNATEQHAVAVSLRGREGGGTAALRACQGGGDKPHVLSELTVRRLTPRECERLQGFPDDWTKVPWRGKSAERCPDGPRYRAIGNAFPPPVMRWIGSRIQAVNEIMRETP